MSLICGASFQFGLKFHGICFWVLLEDAGEPGVSSANINQYWRYVRLQGKLQAFTVFNDSFLTSASWKGLTWRSCKEWGWPEGIRLTLICLSEGQAWNQYCSVATGKTKPPCTHPILTKQAALFSSVAPPLSCSLLPTFNFFLSSVYSF